MNTKEQSRFAADLGALLLEVKAPFICNLNKIFDLPSYNMPRRAALALISDLFTSTPFCNAYGNWLVAEVEGSILQFNPIVTNAVVLVDGKRETAELAWTRL